MRLHLLGRFTPLVALAACSISWRAPHITSSTYLLPGQHATVSFHTTPAGRLEVELHGEGPGSIAFDAHTPEGVTMAKGTLHASARAKCSTTDGSLVIELRAGEQEGTVAWVASGDSSLEIDVVPSAP
jgi:hypothetical protein